MLRIFFDHNYFELGLEWIMKHSHMLKINLTLIKITKYYQIYCFYLFSTSS